ncbi:MAG: ferredoxin [Chloroflexi bacterium]|nr:ferredoxin [Chloroflexota bacterium]
MTKPVVDHNECIGDGLCEQICPEVFELREDGLAYVINENPDEDTKARVDESIEECPTGAISWEG